MKMQIKMAFNVPFTCIVNLKDFLTAHKFHNLTKRRYYQYTSTQETTKQEVTSNVKCALNMYIIKRMYMYVDTKLTQ